MGCPAKKTDMLPGVSYNHEDASWLRRYFRQIEIRFLTLAAKQATPQDHKVFDELTTHMEQVTLTVVDDDGIIYRSTLYSIVTSALVQLEMLATRFQELSSFNQKVLADRNDAQARIAKLEASTSERGQRISDLETAALRHKETRRVDKEKFKSLQAELEEQRAKFAEASSKQNLESTERAELIALRQKVAEQAATIASLEEMATAPAPPASIPPATSAVMAELDHAMQMAADAEISFASERTALNRALEEACQKLVESESERDADKNRLEELEDQVAVLRNAKEAVLTDLESTKSRMSQAEARFEESSKKRFDELNKQVKAISLERDQLTKRIRELKSEHEKQQEQALCAKRGISNQLAEITEHLNKLREKYEETLGELSRQKLLVAELEDLATAPSSDSEELKKALDAKRESDVKATKLEQEVSCLREAFDKTRVNMEQINLELLSMKSERIANRSLIHERQTEIIALEAEIKSLQDASMETSSLLKQIESLEDQREHDADRVDELEKKLAKSSSELENANSALAALRGRLSETPDPLAEARMVLARLDSIKTDLEKRISGVTPARETATSQQPLFDRNERLELEHKIGEWQALKSEIAGVSEDVYEVIQEHKKCSGLVGMRIKDTVDPLSPGDIVMAKQEIADRETEIALLMRYLQDTAQPLTQVAEANILLLGQRLAIHKKLEDTAYRNALTTNIPVLPDPPFVYEDEHAGLADEDIVNAVGGDEEPAQELDNVTVSFDTAFINELAERNGLRPEELLLVTLFELLPNSTKCTSFARIVNSSIKAGILKSFQTSNHKLQQVWIDGKLEDRKIGQWIRYSGSVNRAPIYRRTSIDLAWDTNRVIKPSVRAAFVAAYHSYANGAKKS